MVEKVAKRVILLTGSPGVDSPQEIVDRMLEYSKIP